MRVSSHDYFGFRERFIEILSKMIRSKYCPPIDVLMTAKRFIECTDGAHSAGKFKKENEAALRNMDFLEFNIRHGYKKSIVGFLSEQISMAYDYERCKYVRDTHSSHTDNVIRQIDYFTRDPNGKESGVQVKTARFVGNTIELKDWTGGEAEYLHLVDIDDRRLVIFKLVDFKRLYKNGIVRLTSEQLKFLAKTVDLSDMY